MSARFSAVLTLTLTAALMAPAAEAQRSAKVLRIGVLRLDSPSSDLGRQSLGDLRDGLRDLGYVEGQNVALEIRWAEGKLEQLSALASELVRLRVDLIVTHGPPGVRAAKGVTSTIPIVIGRIDDVDAHGFVTNLARPGGNITGLSFQSGELSGKWLELLREVLPTASRVAALWDATGTVNQLRTVEGAARSLRVRVDTLEVRGPNDFDGAFEVARKGRAEGLVILASPIFTAHRARLADLAARSRLPAIYYNEAFARAGGFMAYGPKQSEFNWRRAATYVDKILKGAKPADLPVEQPMRFELVVNLKTAKALSITVPQSILVRADQVIQ